MENLLLGILVGVGGVGVFYWAVRRIRACGSKKSTVTSQNFITSLRSVAELSVFRVRTKEIITASDHWFGEFGKKYLSWLLTTKHMTMVFEFEVDFHYNLLSPDLQVARNPSGYFSVALPPCSHEVRIIDMRMHSEGKTELLPWLMPDLVGRFFTGGFSVEQKNILIAEAKSEATRLAAGLVVAAESDARRSAVKSLEMLARGFGADRVSIDFAPATEFRPLVDATRIERLLPESE